MKKIQKDKFSIVFNLLVGIIGLIILVSYLVSSNSVPTFDEYIRQNEAKQGFVSVKTPESTIFAKIATSSEDLERGLSGKSSLPYNEGMIFVFEESSSRGFWMHDMAFPIDIVWINKDKVVVGVNSDVSPETYPNIFFPPEPIRYVIELNAGYAEENNIASGTLLTFVI